MSSKAHAEPAIGTGLLEASWDHKWLVVTVTLLFAAAGFGVSFLQSKSYEATAELILVDPRSEGVFREEARLSLDPSRYVRNQAEFIGSTQVAARASELLDVAFSAAHIAGVTNVQPSRDTDLVEITAAAGTPDGAAALANTLVVAYQQLVIEEVQGNASLAIAELERSKAELQVRIDEVEGALEADPDSAGRKAERNAGVAQLVSLDTRIEQISVNAALYGSGVQLFDEAELPTSPARPRPLRNAVAAGMLGVLAGAALAWWRAEQRKEAEHRNDPAAMLETRLLGEIPEFHSVGAAGPAPTASAPDSAASEAYQFVLSSLGFALEESGGSVVLITSPGPADGKTVTALNLAIAAAGDGRRPLLVDTDARIRGLSKLGGNGDSSGISDLALDESKRIKDCVQRWRVSDDLMVHVVPAGSKEGRSASFFRTLEFRMAMRRIRGHEDLVLVDSPPLLAVAETSDIASQVDGVVLVVNQGTPLRVLEDCRERLEMTGSPLLGYVFNRSRPSARRYGYGGYGYGRHRYGKYKYGYGKYGYGYGYGQDGKKKQTQHV